MAVNLKDDFMYKNQAARRPLKAITDQNLKERGREGGRRRGRRGGEEERDNCLVRASTHLKTSL